MSDKIRAHVLDPNTMDPSIRPQDDFYRHVNGAWLAHHEIPADRPVDGAFHALRDLSEERGRAIAEEAVVGTLDDPDAAIIATLWSQFMDEDAINAAGIDPLSPDLDAIANAATRDELDALSGRLMKEGIGSFFGVYVGTDPHDSSAYMLSFVQSGIGLPDEAYYREDAYSQIRDEYVAHLERLIALADIDEDASGAAERIMGLETAFASYHRDSVSNRNPLLSDNQMTWAELRESAPGFGWDQWARGADAPLDDETVVNVDQPGFLTAAARAWGQTSLDDIKLWLSVSLIDARASLLSHEFVEENFSFFGRVLSGTKEIRPRWKRALGLVQGAAGESVGRIWVAKHFPPSSKERMDELVTGLLRAYEEAIRASEWMGEETRRRALDKLATFKPKIGYPPKWKDLTGLDVSEQRPLVANVAAAIAFETMREWKKLGTAVDRDEWLMTPQTVNAYYNPALNEIVFPAAILQPPFFDPEADDAVNFGAIGAVIGHEIGHGFDDQGSRYDAHGNLENWWEEEDRERFDELTSALVDQYDNLTPADLAGDDAPTVNGALTVGENIGDLGGLSIAWAAWATALEAQGLTPESAPVIDSITGPQRFFYSWARVWRTAARIEFATQMLAVDPHSPAEFRCNQVLSNVDEFYAAFDVRPDDAMWLAPAERVRIW